MYFVTFSELLGTGGKEIAQQVAKSLNYTFYGEDELMNAAKEMGFLRDVQELDERGPSMMERFFSERPKIHLDRLQSVIFELAKKGDGVFFGRGSQLLLNSFDCALHVLVTGSLERRVQRIMETSKVSKEVAEKIVTRSDHDKGGFFRFAFGQDWLAPHLYDLVLNTDKLSTVAAVRMVLDAAKSDEIKACGVDSVKSLGKLSLQRRVESALLESGIRSPQLFVTVEDLDWVRVYGLVHTQEEKAEVERALKGFKDIKKLTNDLVVSSAVGV